MNVELSRRVGNLMHYVPIKDLRGKDRLNFLDTVNKATSFDSLTKDVQDIILEAEANAKK